jgi:hypothetical protein
MVRKIAIGFAVLFGLVVATGWMPGTVTETHMTADGPERAMWGMYMMSLVDDITHGVTAAVLLAAGAYSRAASLLALTCFGWYYACDAVFYLLDGIFLHKPIVGNVLLNLPHIVISGVMLWTVYVLGPRTATPATPAIASPSAG